MFPELIYYFMSREVGCLKHLTLRSFLGMLTKGSLAAGLHYEESLDGLEVEVEAGG